MQYFYGILVLGLMGWVVFSYSDDGKSNDTKPTAFTENSTTDLHFRHTIGRSGVNNVSLTLEIPAAELLLKSSSSNILNTDIRYSHQDREPVLDETIRNNGDLKVHINQKSNNKKALRGKENHSIWDLNITPNIPADYDISIGAGKIDLDLSGSQVNSIKLQTGAAQADLNLQNSLISTLDLTAGVGAISVDLSGARHNNITGTIKGGIGSLSLDVPKDTGVRVKASGLGTVNAEGFQRVDGYYINDSWGQTTYSIDLEVAAGMGTVTIYQN